MFQASKLVTQAARQAPALAQAAQETAGAAAAAAASSSQSSRAGGALAGLSPRGSRPFHTVYYPTQKAPDGRIKDPGHIAIETTAQERAQHPGLPAVLGHAPADPKAMDRREEAFTGADGQSHTVQSWHGPARPLAEDKPMDHKFPGVKVIDHGPISPEQAQVLTEAAAAGTFHPEYDTTGLRAPNCVIAANHLHRQLGLTTQEAKPLQMPQDAAAMVDKD